MVEKPGWFKFQEWIAKQLYDIDPNARSSKGSGNCGELADVNNKYLIIEAKNESKKNVYTEKYMSKIISECPIHSDRIPVLFTRNKDGKKRAHLDAKLFLDLFVELTKYREGELLNEDFKKI